MSEGLLSTIGDHYPYSPIQYHDSWLAVDPVIGCKASCSYCLLRLAGWTGVRPEVVESTTDIVEQLVSHRYFIPNETKLCYGTRTDVLMPEVIPHMTAFLTELEKRGLRNPVALISKKEISEETADTIANLRNVRVVFLCSWSALPSHVEKGIRQGSALATMRRLTKRQVPVIHYFRPMLPANTDELTLREVLSSAATWSRATVHVGIKLNDGLQRFYTESEILKPAAGRPSDEGSWTPPEAVQNLRRIAAEICPEHPLYEHTSCAVSHVLGEADYTATIHRPSICKPSRCPSLQRARCADSRKVPTASEVETSLARIGLTNSATVEGEHIHIDGSLSQEDYCYLLHRFNVPIASTVNFFRVFRGSIFSTPEAVPEGQPATSEPNAANSREESSHGL
ncbi:hypothetical protein QEZ54_10535 [Catellatospora sp. KI3]|uniref:hypothetical protein n=1 Tax=Catellatospora sp. KI3 TaxID=3041620 RepID=UPI0024825D7C|nr:hypothetical protein [Catellatospora sp. KI3]MDI1461406.1 hypothetical protein [Catellatospora sp. KI3]